MSERGRWPDDTRGIVDPAEMMRHVDFARHPAGSDLEGIIDWFWSVEWSLPNGVVHVQHVLNHPSGHISVGTIDESGVTLDPARGRVYGVLTGVSERRLADTGWTVAAKTTVGGLGVLLSRPASDVTDRRLDLGQALAGMPAAEVVADIIAASTPERRSAVLRTALMDLVADRPEEQLAEARRVGEIARLAERDRSVYRVEQLAAAGQVSVRTLQRLFDAHVGIGPAWVIRRWRIIEAAEAARRAADVGDDWPGWSTVAAELGYADQAHLIRDFRRHLGTTPARYLARSRDLIQGS